MENNNIYIIFFKDKKKTHIFAKLIQLGSKINNIIEKDLTQKPVNHVAIGYLMGSQMCLYEALAKGGTQINSFERRVFDYNGKIYMYKISDLKITQSDIEKYISNNCGKKYSVVGALASYEFFNNKWIIFKPVNRFFDWLRKHFSNRGVFCSYEVANTINSLCQDTANKTCKIYKQFISKNKLDEITPQDLKRVCNEFYKPILLK